ncbi:hypothetical protein LCGC14_1243560, partial [marine sediment metagenome]
MGTLEDIGGILDATLIPALKFLGDVLTDQVFPAIAKVFNFLRDNKEFLAAVGIAIIAVLVPGIIAWTVATIANVVAHIALAAAMLVAYAPILAIIAAIALLAFGIIQLIKHWDEVIAFFTDTVGPFFTETIPGFFTDLLDKIMGFGADVLQFLEDNWKTIVQVALGILFPPAGGLFFIITHFGEVKEKVLGIVTGLKDAVVGFFTDLKDKALSVISSFAGFLKDHWKEIVSVALGILFPPAGGLFYIITHFGEVKERVLGIVTDLKDRVIALIEGIGAGIARVAATVYNAAWQLAVDVKDRFFRGLGRIAGWGEDIVRGIWNGIASLRGWALGNLSGLGADFIDRFKRGLGNMYETGKAIVRGLWAGISALASWIYDKVYDFAKGIYDSIKGALGSIWPGSPSQAGIDIGKGLVAGLE